jgi:hypothetical protein
MSNPNQVTLATGAIAVMLFISQPANAVTNDETAAAFGSQIADLAFCHLPTGSTERIFDAVLDGLNIGQYERARLQQRMIFVRSAVEDFRRRGAKPPDCDKARLASNRATAQDRHLTALQRAIDRKKAELGIR